jgi:2'-5' RNA ligase
MNALRVARAFLKRLHAVDRTRSFSSVQSNLPLSIAQEIYDWGRQNIPDDILTGDGRENNIHTTIKFGLHTADFTAVRDLFIHEKPIKIVLGKISLFNLDDHDVIKIDVISPELHRLNHLISNSMAATDTHPEYHPHVTLAYVKKGAGAAFDGLDPFEGRKIVLDSVLFSGKDNRKTVFKLVEGSKYDLCRSSKL